MTLVEIGELGHRFRYGSLRIRLGGAPRFTFDGPPTGDIAKDFGDAAVQRAHGAVELGDLRFPLRLAGWSPAGQLTARQDGDIAFSITGDLVDEALAALLADTHASPGCTLVYQIGPDETPDALIERIAGDIETRPRAGEALVAPPPFGCLLRSGAMPTAEFFDLAVGVIGSDSPALGGWRVLPGNGRGRASSVSFSVSDRDQATELSPDAWDIVGAFGPVGAGNSARPLVLRHLRKGTPYEPLDQVLPALLDMGLPGEKRFGGDEPVPGAPGWVRMGSTEWFAEEIVVGIGVDERGADDAPARVSSVELVLRPSPRLPVPKGLPCRVVRARVEAWSEAGDVVLVTPDGSDWRLAGPAETFGETLGVECLTPAQFGDDGGGIYLRPHQGDPRHVLLIQGQPPVSAGAPMAKDAEVEDEEVDIRIKGAVLDLVGGDAQLTAGNGELKGTADSLVEITGTVQVKGEFDVS